VLDPSRDSDLTAPWYIAAVAAVSLVLGAPARAEQKPLWEAGVGVGTLVFDDYRGADTERAYPVPVPYFVYRGTFLKADDEGVRGQFFSNRLFDLTLSLNATTPVSSRDSDARAGMPDLQPTFEIGPELDVHLWHSADRRARLDLQLPIRRAITLALHPDGVGWIAAPCLELDLSDLVSRAGWNAGLQFGPLFADGSYDRYYYEVQPRYATAARAQFRPGGGYAGTEFLASTSRRFARLWVFAFLRHDSLDGASFVASPLVRSRDYWLGGVGIAWLFGRSGREVTVDVAPD
jgi:MipA family protein